MSLLSLEVDMVQSFTFPSSNFKNSLGTSLVVQVPGRGDRSPFQPPSGHLGDPETLSLPGI